MNMPTYLESVDSDPLPLKRTRLQTLLHDGPTHACNQCGALWEGEEGVYVFMRLPEKVLCSGVCANIRKLSHDERMNVALALWQEEESKTNRSRCPEEATSEPQDLTS